MIYCDNCIKFLNKSQSNILFLLGEAEFTVDTNERNVRAGERCVALKICTKR